jgi:hypothetical protein
MVKLANKQSAALAAEASTDSTKEAIPAGYGRLVALQNSNMNALTGLHVILRDGVIEWSNDLLDFAGRRLQQHLDKPRGQINGAHAADAVAWPLRYFQTAAEQYVEQMARFLTLASKLSRDSRMHLENHAFAMLSQLEHEDESFLKMHHANERSDRFSTDGRGDKP